MLKIKNLSTNLFLYLNLYPDMAFQGNQARGDVP